jgi:DUF1365 family protein
MPRWLGYAFNPITLYYCYDLSNQTFLALVAEVHNTFNEAHLYFLDPSNTSVRQARKGYTEALLLRLEIYSSTFASLSFMLLYCILYLGSIMNG